MAASARRSSASAVSVGSAGRARTRPMLAPTPSGVPVDHERVAQRGQDAAGRSRSASRGRVARAAPRTRRRRAGRPGRRPADAAAQPVGDRVQQAVAHRVAEAVVDQLEVVEVGEEQRDGLLRVPVRRPARSTSRSRNSARLASPVSGSWYAWWCSRCWPSDTRASSTVLSTMVNICRATTSPSPSQPRYASNGVRLPAGAGTHGDDHAGRDHRHVRQQQMQPVRFGRAWTGPSPCRG